METDEVGNESPSRFPKFEAYAVKVLISGFSESAYTCAVAFQVSGPRKLELETTPCIMII